MSTPVSLSAAATPPVRTINAWWIVVLSGLGLLVLAALFWVLTRDHRDPTEAVRAVAYAIPLAVALPAGYVTVKRQQTLEDQNRTNRAQLVHDQDKEQTRVAEAQESERRRTHELSTADGRAQTADYRARYVGAAQQLGADEAITRLAGVYALGNLADDWGASDRSQRQACIDVLCAYLRLPYNPDGVNDASSSTDEISGPVAETEPGYRKNLQKRSTVTRKLTPNDRDVRLAIIKVIAAHLQPFDDDPDAAAISWQGHDFDFTAATFDGGSFDGATFSDGRVSFDDAHFVGGLVSFRDTKFCGARVSFDFATLLRTRVLFNAAEFSAGTVSFTELRLNSSTLSFGAAGFTGAQVNFREASFTSGRVAFGNAVFSDGRVRFSSAKFTGATMHFSGATVTGGEVLFNTARFSGSHVNFDRSRFTGGWVTFNGSTFTDGSVTFVGASFDGGRVTNENGDFRGWGKPPERATQEQTVRRI